MANAIGASHTASGGWLLFAVFVGPIALYNIARIIDPVRIRRWEALRWWRFPRNALLPEHLDFDQLASSRARRVRDRIDAIVMLALLVLIALSMRWLL